MDSWQYSGAWNIQNQTEILITGWFHAQSDREKFKEGKQHSSNRKVNKNIDCVHSQSMTRIYTRIFQVSLTINGGIKLICHCFVSFG